MTFRWQVPDLVRPDQFEVGRQNEKDEKSSQQNWTKRHLSKLKKKELLNIVKNKNEQPKAVQRATTIVIENGGIDYAHKKMLELKKEALELLNNIPDSAAKQALIGLVEYTILRDK